MKELEPTKTERSMTSVEFGPIASFVPSRNSNCPVPEVDVCMRSSRWIGDDTDNGPLSPVTLTVMDTAFPISSEANALAASVICSANAATKNLDKRLNMQPPVKVKKLVETLGNVNFISRFLVSIVDCAVHGLHFTG